MVRRATGRSGGLSVRVTMIGSGYVGLVTGICLAEVGHDVTCVERDADRVERIMAGHAPIHEAGLEPLLRKHVGTTFRVTTDLATAVAAGEVTVIAVGTPSREGRIDLADVTAAASQIGAALPKDGFPVIVVKSTVIPGTTDTVVRTALEDASGRNAGVDFGVAVNPEFLTEGRAVADFMAPDRIVLGADDERSLRLLRELYAPFAGVDIVEVNTRTAELIKYASNALLATAISFSNELANLAESIGGIDLVEVMRGVHRSRYLTVRNGDQQAATAELADFLLAGGGFGGSCLPKDVSALVATGIDRGEQMPLLSAVLEVNQARSDRLIGMLREELATLRGRRIGVLGLAFKPDTDDVRESPALRLIERLVGEGAIVRAHDPVVREADVPTLADAGITIERDLVAIVEGVEALVLVTAWADYRRLPALVAAAPDPPIVVDGRRMIPADSVARYRGIGLR